MTVFVDDMRAPLGRMVMSHMMADTTEELLAMADKIGLDRRWLQKAGIWQEHFDVSQAFRAKAVAAGAVEVTQRQIVMMMRARRIRTGPAPGEGEP